MKLGTYTESLNSVISYITFYFVPYGKDAVYDRKHDT